VNNLHRRLFAVCPVLTGAYPYRFARSRLPRTGFLVWRYVAYGHGSVACGDSTSQTFNSVTDSDWHVSLSLGDGRVFTDMVNHAPANQLRDYGIVFSYAEAGVYTLTVQCS